MRIALLILLLLVGAAWAEVVEPNHEDHQSLRKLRDQAVEAVNKSDVAGLLALMDEQATFTAMNAEVCHGHPAIKAYFDRMLTGPDRTVEKMHIGKVEVDRLTDLYEGNTGVTSGTCEGDYDLKGGMKFSVTCRWSSTLIKHDGAWKIVAIHFSTNLFDNPLLNMAKRSVVYFAVGFGLFGLLLGFVVGRLSKRR